MFKWLAVEIHYSERKRKSLKLKNSKELINEEKQRNENNRDVKNKHYSICHNEIE